MSDLTLGTIMGAAERFRCRRECDDDLFIKFALCLSPLSIRRLTSVINKLNEIQRRLNDYNELKNAYARSIGETYTVLPPPADFVREYTAGLAGEIVSLAVNFGFQDLVAQAFLLDPLPGRRFIPEPVKSQLRPRLYERDSDLASVRDTVVRNGIRDIDADIGKLIIALLASGDRTGAAAAMRDLKTRGKVLEDAELSHFQAGISYVTPRLAEYAVDHDPSLAEHWVKGGGNRTSVADRHNVVEGKAYSKLDLATRIFNPRKSSRDLSGELQRFKTNAWVSPPFTSAIAKDVNQVADNQDAVTIDSHSLTAEDGTPFIPL